MRCEELKTLLGVYVLGAIDPAERAGVDSHLGSCPSCRDELAGMAGLPALLGRVTEEQIANVAGPPPELLDSVLAQAVRERRRQHWRLGGLGGLGRLGRFGGGWPLVAAAAVVLLVAGVGLGGLVLSDEPATRMVTGPTVLVTVTPSPTPTASSSPAEELSASNPATGVSARIVVIRKRWGTLAELHLKGVPRGFKCRLEAIAENGSRDSMGSWTVAYGGYHEFLGATMLYRDQVAAFEIVTAMGQNMLTIPA